MELVALKYKYWFWFMYDLYLSDIDVVGDVRTLMVNSVAPMDCVEFGQNHPVVDQPILTVDVCAERDNSVTLLFNNDTYSPSRLRNINAAVPMVGLGEFDTIYGVVGFAEMS